MPKFGVFYPDSESKKKDEDGVEALFDPMRYDDELQLYYLTLDDTEDQPITRVDYYNKFKAITPSDMKTRNLTFFNKHKDGYLQK